MEASVECTHCGVVMTSWSAAGSPIRYFQCPFCARTHSSLYGEVFRRRAGARVLDSVERAPSTPAIPMASQEEVRWARIKASAARWFARLEAEEQRCTPAGATTHPVRVVVPGRAPAAARAAATRAAPAAAGRKR